MKSLIGQTLGRYQLIGPIGEGGMAAIYKAYQPKLNRYVAIKILPPECPPESPLARRFTREAQVAALLDHPNILPIYDFDRQDGISYLVLKYVPDGTLNDKLGRPLPLAETLRLIECMASALDEAHAHGVIHCDVTPRNVLIDRRGWPYLADFGLSRVVEMPALSRPAVPPDASMEDNQTQDQNSAPEPQTDLFALGGVLFDMLTGQTRYAGTPAYMSPEQGQGLPVDARTDVYALGAILFEMLTGRLLYEAETEMGVVLKQITSPVPSPRQFNAAIPPTVEQVILKAVAKNPADRFASAGALASALSQAIQSSDEPDGATAPHLPIPQADVLSPLDPSLPQSPALLPDPAPVPPRSWFWLLPVIGGAVITIGLCGLLYWMVQVM